jgi:hypothetical protein
VEIANPAGSSAAELILFPVDKRANDFFTALFAIPMYRLDTKDGTLFLTDNIMHNLPSLENLFL